jgi:hypothetical protein
MKFAIVLIIAIRYNRTELTMHAVSSDRERTFDESYSLRETDELTTLLDSPKTCEPEKNDDRKVRARNAGTY